MGISEKWKQIPVQVKLFLLKAAILFAIWKLLYLLVLLPNRTLDEPLTYSIAANTAGTLNLFSEGQLYSVKSEINQTVLDGLPFSEKVVNIYLRDQKVLMVADVCNGLELMVLYAGFIICIPAGIYRKTVFIVGGIVSIFMVNVLRCAALVMIYLHHPQFVYFSHHYFFTFITYGFIFWLWYIFSKRQTLFQKLKTE
jgi:exosortase/archaeosortase family protein